MLSFPAGARDAGLLRRIAEAEGVGEEGLGLVEEEEVLLLEFREADLSTIFEEDEEEALGVPFL